MTPHLPRPDVEPFDMQRRRDEGIHGGFTEKAEWEVLFRANVVLNVKVRSIFCFMEALRWVTV